MSYWFHKGTRSELSSSNKCTGEGGGTIIPGSPNCASVSRDDLCFWKRNDGKELAEALSSMPLCPISIPASRYNGATGNSCFQTYSSILTSSTLPDPPHFSQSGSSILLLNSENMRISCFVSFFSPKGSEQILIGQLCARHRARAGDSATNKMGQDTILLDTATCQLCDLPKATFTQ